MIRALFTSATGMIAQQLNIDTIANNLANVNTTGFKKSRVNFQDLMYETTKQAGTETTAGTTTPEGIQIGHGVRPSSIAKIYTTGSLINTGTSTDVAIEGDGFFQIQLPDGTTAYTRDGAFKVNSEGTLMTADGYPIQPGITLPTNYEDLTIGSDGTVSVSIPGQTTPQTVGVLELARFPNPAGLDASLGSNLLLESGASGAPQTGQPGLEGIGSIAQGFLENSNVQTVEEIIQMIIAQRAYEASSKVIQTSDEMLQTANNVKQ